MIYIATHKKFDVPVGAGYIPLQVGALGRKKLGYTTDAQGDTISSKNDNYCELTGLYWIWKNSEDPYKGIVHYRRYFGKSNLFNTKKYIYSYEELLEFLKKYDIVLPYKEFFLQSAKDDLMISCCTEDIFDELRQIIDVEHHEYLDVFDAYFAGNRSVLFNMMFCRREVFDQYAEWLFSILFALEKKVDMSILNAYQKRLYGFLAERLLNVWIIKNQLKCKNVCVVHTEMSFPDRINLIRRRYTNGIRFWMKGRMKKEKK